MRSMNQQPDTARVASCLLQHHYLFGIYFIVGELPAAHNCTENRVSCILISISQPHSQVHSTQMLRDVHLSLLLKYLGK